MKNTYSKIIKTLLFCALAWTTACQTNTTANNNAGSQQPPPPPANTTTVNSSQTGTKPATNGNQTEIAKTETTTAPAGSLATPTEAYKTAYAARKNKDIAGLKRVMSKDMLEFFTIIVQDQNKTVDDALRQLTETPQNPSDESRNEKITGDTATIEYLDEKGNWRTMDFAKEGSDWKLTMPKAISTGDDKTKKGK